MPQVTSWTVGASQPAAVSSRVLAGNESLELRCPFAKELQPEAQVTSTRFDGSLASAISLPITAPKLKVLSYSFGVTGAWRNQLPKTPAEASQLPALTPPSAPNDEAAAKARTRIQPPGEVIKLADRLFYVLQPSLEAMIGDSAPVVLTTTLRDAIHTAVSSAQPGDIVLLSPGCASFDEFTDYKQRGDFFQDVVRNL